MWTKSSDRHESLIEWTFDEAPDAEEPAAPSRQPAAPSQGEDWRPAPRPGRAMNRAWLLIVAVPMLAIALNAVWPRLEAWRTRHAIDSVVQQQEQALAAGDQAGLRASFKNPGGAWADAQVHRLQAGWQPAAFGLPGARLDGQPGTIVSYQVLGPMLVQADVARGYVLSDGSHAVFAWPQYYQYDQNAWRQVPAPPLPHDDREALNGGRVFVHYNPADTDLAASTAAELEMLLARACADWGCSPDIQVAVVFGLPDPKPMSDPTSISSLSGSLTFQMVAAGQTRLPDLVVKLPTRDWAGYPADTAAESAVQRSAAVQTLANVADRLAGGAPGMDGTVRPLLYALVVRELARLGIESPALSDLRAASPTVSPDSVWSLPASKPISPETLLRALAVLNQLMAGRSVTDEQHLLHALGQAHDPAAWLAAGLGLTQSQAQAAWASLLQRP